MPDEGIPVSRARYRILVYNADSEFVSDAIVGPNSLGMEFEYLPVGWKITVLRIKDDPGAPKGSPK